MKIHTNGILLLFLLIIGCAVADDSTNVQGDSLEQTQILAATVYYKGEQPRLLTLRKRTIKQQGKPSEDLNLAVMLVDCPLTKPFEERLIWLWYGYESERLMFCPWLGDVVYRAKDDSIYIVLALMPGNSMCDAYLSVHKVASSTSIGAVPDFDPQRIDDWPEASPPPIARLHTWIYEGRIGRLECVAEASSILICGEFSQWLKEKTAVYYRFDLDSKEWYELTWTEEEAKKHGRQEW